MQSQAQITSVGVASCATTIHLFFEIGCIEKEKNIYKLLKAFLKFIAKHTGQFNVLLQSESTQLAGQLIKNVHRGSAVVSTACVSEGVRSAKQSSAAGF